MLANGKLNRYESLNYEVLDGRVLKLIGDDLIISNNLLYSKNEIIDLTTSLTVDIFGKEQIYNIDSYSKISKNVIMIESVKRTKASFFLLPLIQDSKCISSTIGWGTYFVNCYAEISYPFYEGDNLYILYRNVNSDEYRKFEYKMMSKSNYIDSIEIDNFHTCMVFRFNNKDRIKELFVKGKYSEFPENYKKNILYFHNLNYESEIADVLYKRESRRLFLMSDLNEEIKVGAELYSIPQLETEILNFKL